jgi:hypothetical protein
MLSMLTAPNVSDNFILLTTLVLLMVLVVLVGQRAGASDIELNPDAGYSRPILALELNAGAAPQMFKSWDKATRERLRAAVLWDYLFLFIYPAAVATACFIAARFLENKGILPFRYGLIIIFLQLLAAMLDAVENFALLRVLDGAIQNPWPPIARWCAISKFLLVAVGGIYALIIGGGAWLYTLVKSLFDAKPA